MRQLYVEGSIHADTNVWQEGMTDWLPLKNTELAAVLDVVADPLDPWRICAYSGDKVRESETVQLGGFSVSLRWKDEAVQYLQQGGELPKADAVPRVGIPSLDLGAIMGKAWEMLKGIWGPAMVVFMLTMTPMQIGNAFMQGKMQRLQTEFKDGGTDPSVATEALQSFIIELYSYVGAMIGLAMLISVFYHCGVFGLLSRYEKGAPVTAGDGLRSMFVRWFPALTTNVIFGLTAMLGLFLCCLPFFIVLGMGSLAVFIAVDRGMHGHQSLVESFRLVGWPNFWRTLGYMLVVGLMIGIPAGGVSLVVNLGAQSVPALANPWIVGVISAVASLPQLYYIAFMFVYYRSLQARDALNQQSQVQR
jgi:hypothetical protein